MKILFSIVFIVLLGGICRAQELPPCLVNPDKLYNRTDVLKKFVEVLKGTIPEQYKNSSYANFSVREQRARVFFVQDLTDVSNVQMVKSLTGANCINFIDKHVYHFAAYWIPFSFNHIVFLDNGELKFFRAINCPQQGDKLEDVISLLNLKLKKGKTTDEVIFRVKNHREYGRYITIDDTDIRCQEIPKN
jgi:hypothetical protein